MIYFQRILKERIIQYGSGKISSLDVFLICSSGCAGTWVWQEDYPKHRTMSFKCPRWNYNEAYDKLHHIYATRQHEPIKVNDKKRGN